MPEEHRTHEIARFTHLQFSIQHLALSIFLVLFTSCSDPVPPDVIKLREEREGLQIEIGKLQKKAETDARRIRTMEEDLRIKTRDWSDRSTRISEESRARQEQVEILVAENQQLKNQLEGYQKTEKLQARTEAKGGAVPVLKTRDGNSYHNVTIRSVVPDGIHILHETGATKILFANLDNSWGDRFGYNTKEAEAYSKELSRQRALAQKSQMEAIQAQQAQEKADLEDAKLNAARKPIEAENQLIRQLANLRSLLYAELQQINSEYKGKLNLAGTSPANPEDSPAFNNNLATLRLSYARDLRAQINDLKSKLGMY